jgi:pimeloyl-ACP methyl ester carboxylesterase
MLPAMTERNAGPALWVESGGSGSPTLLLLHGLGAHAAVWQRLLPHVIARWPGRWIAPDLRGHGRSGRAASYSFGAHAADVARLLEPHEPVAILGHSMGGVVAMTLASGWFGIEVRKVVAFGVKLVWTEAEIARARELACTPVRWFGARGEALERHLLVSGLKGLIDPGDAMAAPGVAEESGRFRLAADPGVNDVVGADIAHVIAAMTAPLHLAAGERDPMVSLAHMQRFDAGAEILPGLGHNPHVEAPEALWQFAERALL